MQTHTVLYRDDSLQPLDAPYGFICEADDTDHAEEQCENAYPGCNIVWVCLADNLQEALDDYWGIWPA
jgi:hypothetical protein